MYSLSNTLPFKILNMEKTLLDNQWKYQNVCSPFFRMFYILNGNGSIFHGSKEYHLTPNSLILIPNYTNCSYYCENSLEMIYIIFSNQLHNELKMYDFHNHIFTQDTALADKCLFLRLLELNPDMGLSDYNPQKYDNLDYLDKCKTSESEKPLSNTFESQGILLQLFSRFKPLSKETANYNDTSLRIIQTIQYINNNLDKNITVKQLAQNTCLSPDYFSRLFLQATKSRPIEFIQRKKIEKAQLLLLTTNHSLEKIAELTGLSTSSYLIRLFRRYTGTAPKKWRENCQKENTAFF